MDSDLSKKKSKPLANNTDAIIGRNLKKFRIVRGKSQQMLAQEIGLTFQQIQKYEKGTNRIPSSRLYDIAKALNIDIEAFFYGLEEIEVESCSASLANLDKKALETIEIFQRVSDIKARNSILSVMRLLVERQESNK